MLDVCQTISSFNAGRDPDRLQMKYNNMRTSAFIFLRGTCHLFYDRLPQHDLMQSAPLAWVCGDLHLENFGSYKGDNRLAYFDMNDFDEAALAPVTWELIRFVTSILIGAKSIGVSSKGARELAEAFIEAYACSLATGKSRWVERETATGLVRNLLDSLRMRQRQDFLDKRTVFKAAERRLRIDGKKALPVTPKQRAKIEKFINEFAKTQADKKFFKPLDIARRVAGTGSLGVDRYIILVYGKGSPNENYLLDLKQAVPSSLVCHLKTPQPNWGSEAERVVTLQRRVQAVSMAFLQPVIIGKDSYILRALQPTEDRVSLDLAQSSMEELDHVMCVMGNVVASANLRSSGRQGSANADELIAFGQKKAWRKTLLQLAEDCATQVNKDWKTYSAAYDKGQFTVKK